jgi:hypothetical protein
MDKKKLLEKYVYFKMYLSRAYTHVQILFTILSIALSFSVWMKLFNISNWWLIPIIMLMFFGLLTVGWADMHYGFFRTEISINNEHNKAMQELLKKNGEN